MEATKPATARMATTGMIKMTRAATAFESDEAVQVHQQHQVCHVMIKQQTQGMAASAMQCNVLRSIIAAFSVWLVL